MSDRSETGWGFAFLGLLIGVAVVTIYGGIRAIDRFWPAEEISPRLLADRAAAIKLFRIDKASRFLPGGRQIMRRYAISEKEIEQPCSVSYEELVGLGANPDAASGK